MSGKPRTNIAWSMASIVAKNALTLLTFVVLARMMEPAAFGVISIALIGCGFALSFVDSGFTNVVVRQQSLDVKLLSSLYWWNVAVGGCAAVLLALAGPLAAAYFHDGRLPPLFAYAGISLLLVALGQQFIVILQRELSFGVLASIEIISQVIICSVALVRAWSGAGPVSYFEGMCAGYAFLSAAAFLAARKVFVPKWRFSFADVRSVSRFGLFNTGERCVSFINANFEKPLIGRLFSMADLGLYTIVNQLITRPVSLISNALSRVAYSMYAKLQDDHEALNRLYIRYAGKLALITFPLYGFMYLFGEPLIRLLFGDAYAPAARLLGPLCVLGAIWSIGNPLGSYLMALNKAGTGLALNCYSTVVTIAVLVAGSAFSIRTMLWLWVGAVVLLLLPVEWTIRYRLTRMSIVRYLGYVLPHAVFVGAITGIGTQMGRFIDFRTDPVLIVAAMAIYGAVCGAYWLGVNKWVR